MVTAYMRLHCGSDEMRNQPTTKPTKRVRARGRRLSCSAMSMENTILRDCSLWRYHPWLRGAAEVDGGIFLPGFAAIEGDDRVSRR